MSEIKVGDSVRWESAEGWQVGIVECIVRRIAWIRTSPRDRWIVGTIKLQRNVIELANAAAGDVAQGAIQAVVDDYAFAVGLAGDLGRAEPI